MDIRLIEKYDVPAPRYTSYPTAPHFNEAMPPRRYGDWLARAPANASLSLYLHVPFCQSLCWFCGCHTRVLNRPEPLAAYLEALEAEMSLVAARLPVGPKVRHIHWGGGTPTILEADQLSRLMAGLRARFDIAEDAEIAVEIDPRRLSDARIEALAAAGFTRASLGVQDVDPVVQTAVNRLQPFETIRAAVEGLRAVGIGGLNIDLMYGLPYQTRLHVETSVDAVASLAPDRLALFGYAHVPHMKAHMRLIDESTLPGAADRFEQAQAAGARLERLGYEAIGLDHFARGHDPMARAARDGRLRRNFQGYTTDPADMLIGFGASAIGGGPIGYVQNQPDVRRYSNTVMEGRLAALRGRALDHDDRLRRALIERLMCDMAVDVDKVCAAFGTRPEALGLDIARMIEMEADGLIRRRGWRLVVPLAMRPFLRLPATLFDAYLGQGAARHARAV